MIIKAKESSHIIKFFNFLRSQTSSVLNPQKFLTL